MWLFKVDCPSNNIMTQLLILHSDASWAKFQKYNKNVKYWINLLDDYNWDILLNKIDDINFEKFVDQKFYPTLVNINASTGFSKLKSKHLGIRSRECRFNPDWDEDIILNLFELFSQYLAWNSPTLPNIKYRVQGQKFDISLNKVIQKGLKKFILDNNVFSYAITSPKKIKYTVFNPLK